MAGQAALRSPRYALEQNDVAQRPPRPREQSCSTSRLHVTLHDTGSCVRSSRAHHSCRLACLALPRRAWVAERKGDSWHSSRAEASNGQGETVPPFDIRRLELYTERFKAEALVVSAVVEGEDDQVVVFRGFSSSLMRPTAAELGEAVLPPNAEGIVIDRIKGPFNPSNVKYLEEDITWERFDETLKSVGL